MDNLPENTTPPPNPPTPQPVTPQPPATSPSPEIPSTPPEQPTRFPKWLVIALIVIALLTLSLTGWWAYNRFFSQKQTVSTQETDRPFVFDADNQRSADSVTYTSQKCRYQINYPQNWQIYTQAEQEETGAVLIASSQVQSETVSTNEVRIQLGCADTDPSLSPQTIVNNLNSRYQGKNATLSQVKSTIIGGKTAFYQTITPGPVEEYYIFPTTSRVIIINITPTNSTQIETARDTIQKLIFF